MPFIVYATPNFTENAVRFLHALTQISNLEIGLITQEPISLLRENIRQKIAAHAQVSNPFDPMQLEDKIRLFQERWGTPHRLMGAVETIQEPLAQVRAVLGIEGMNPETARNFRDKALMKAKLREAGIPCAKYATAANPAEVRLFAQTCGFPIIAKPPSGMGSLSTYKIQNSDELELVIHLMKPGTGNEILLEEFITGAEHSFDTFSLNGEPVFHSICQYFPNPIEVMREPWIQWQVIIPNNVESSEYDDIRKAAFQTLDVLGMQTGMSHLEWFRRPDGSIAVSEVAARPPGAQITTLISRANDFDAVSAWAKMVIFGTFEPPKRQYAVGAAYLRGLGHGHVKGVHGLEEIERELGHLVTDAKIPEIGKPKAGNYEGEGYIIIRHPETEVVKAALQKIVSTVRVELG